MPERALQKKWGGAIGFGGSALGVFGAVYYLVCNVKGYNRGSSKMINLVIRTDPDMSMVEACLRKLGKEIVNILLMKPAVIIPFIVVLVLLLYREKRMMAFEFCCVCMAAAGLAVNAIITMPGNSHTYFAKAAIVPAWCFVMIAEERLNISEWIGHTAFRLYKGAVIFLFLIGVVCFAQGYTNNENRKNMVYSVSDGTKMIYSRITGNERKEERQEYLKNGYTLTQEEYEALNMMAHDGDQQAVVLHIVPEEKEDLLFYRGKLIGSFSAKYILHDEAAVDRLVQNSGKEYQRLYDMGVRYIVLDFEKDNNVVISDVYTEELYMGEQMKVYRIKPI